ncbi:MAG: 4Fe-4S dicluster domain-containing protein [Rhodospirillales bacterium]
MPTNDHSPLQSVPRVLDSAGLGRLLGLLQGQDYALKGPRIRDGAVVYDDLGGLDDLPVGWVDEQAPGRYRLHQTGNGRRFDFTVATQGWKRFLFPPKVTLWTAKRDDAGAMSVEADRSHEAEAPQAFIGVRPCELKAIQIQDKVFRDGVAPDPAYGARRDRAFVVLLQCARAGEQCFCTSVGAGPRADAGFDLALTELGSGDDIRYLVEAGSERGHEVLATIGGTEAGEAETTVARAQSDAVAESMTKTLPGDARAVLADATESPHWQDVAARCISCGNCTLSCPTCFCSTQTDTVSLDASEVRHERRWDSCFGFDFSHLIEGPARTSGGARYRQWITHKLSAWWDQFGTSGCTGCGRCITWCPVGIDITEEVRTLKNGVRKEGAS